MIRGQRPAGCRKREGTNANSSEIAREFLCGRRRFSPMRLSFCYKAGNGQRELRVPCWTR